MVSLSRIILQVVTYGSLFFMLVLKGVLSVWLMFSFVSSSLFSAKYFGGFFPQGNKIYILASL
jgi:hypothetical protein